MVIRVEQGKGRHGPLRHALPDSFHRLRADGARGDSLALCRRLLDAGDTGACEPVENRAKGDRLLTTSDFTICPDCGGTVQRIATVPLLQPSAIVV